MGHREESDPIQCLVSPPFQRWETESQKGEGMLPGASSVPGPMTVATLSSFSMLAGQVPYLCAIQALCRAIERVSESQIA